MLDNSILISIPHFIDYCRFKENIAIRKCECYNGSLGSFLFVCFFRNSLAILGPLCFHVNTDPNFLQKCQVECWLSRCGIYMQLNFSHKEWDCSICSNMGGCRGYNTKWNKSIKKGDGTDFFLKVTLNRIFIIIFSLPIHECDTHLHFFFFF